MDSEVKLSLMMDDKTRQAWVRVSLKSNRPCMTGVIWNHLDVDADCSNLEYRVSCAAAALCIKQAADHGDRHSENAVIKACMEALKDVQKQAEEARRGRGRGNTK